MVACSPLSITGVNMSDKKEDTNIFDDRFSLEDYDGILRSLELVADGIFTDKLRKDKADLLIKILGAARMTISERRKSTALTNQAVNPQPLNSKSQSSIGSTGPFSVYPLPKKMV